MKLNIIIVNYFIVMGNSCVKRYNLPNTTYKNNNSLEKHHIIPMGEMLQCINKKYNDVVKEACKNELRNSIPLGVNFKITVSFPYHLHYINKTHTISSISSDKYFEHYHIMYDSYLERSPISKYLRLLYNDDKLDNDKNLELLPECKILINDKQYELYKKITQ